MDGHLLSPQIIIFYYDSPRKINRPDELMRFTRQFGQQEKISQSRKAIYRGLRIQETIIEGKIEDKRDIKDYLKESRAYTGLKVSGQSGRQWYLRFFYTSQLSVSLKTNGRGTF